MKNKIYKILFNIPFFKKWYIGNEILKNPPTVTMKNGKMEGLSFTNVTCKIKKGDFVKNCDFETTYNFPINDTDNDDTTDYLK